jgi:hypothetical protein
MIRTSALPGRWRSLLLLCVFGMLVAASASALQVGRPLPPQPQPTGPAYMKIRVEGDEVTADIRNTPLQQVLAELAARTGVVFEIQSQENPPISISLYRVGLQEGIQRIVSSENSILYYAKDAAGQSRIEYVRVFPRANQPPQPSLLYFGTGAVTKSGDDTVDTPEQAVKVLTESQNLEARQKAIEVLVKAKGDMALLALEAALADSAPEVRVAAIEGLASLGVRSALRSIVLSLKDKHPGVRQSAIVAVALLGDSENVRDLKPLSRDPDASVAAAADLAIRKLSSARRP